MRKTGWLGLLLSLVVVTLGPGIFPASAAARGTRGATPDGVPLVGQVLSVDSIGGNPTGFILQTKTHIVACRIAAHATFTARSAEAEVEGFRDGDYAIVKARPMHQSWIALHITFDVRPLHLPEEVSVTATVVSESANGHSLTVRLPSSRTRTVILVPRTTFQENAIPTSTPPTFVRGDLVHIVMRATPKGWIALSIDLSSAPSGLAS